MNGKNTFTPNISTWSDTSTVWVVHYTDEKDFRLRPIEIQNEWVKPSGGLWVSPVESSYGWKDWCEDNGYPLGRYKVTMQISLGRNITVRERADLDRLIWQRLGSNFYNIRPNFEQMVKEYDTIWLTQTGVIETHLLTSASLDAQYYGAGLYGWDCESILIMNEKVVRRIITV